MTPESLLRELESTTHAVRQRKMVELGRASLGDASLKATLAELGSTGDAYARALAVASLYGSRDPELALRLFVDRSRTVRRAVARALPVLFDDETVARAIGAAVNERARAALLVRLRRRERIAPIDRFFEGVASLRDAPLLLDSLPFASDAMVARSLDLLEELGSPLAWSRLAKNHSHRVGSSFQAALARSGGSLGSDMRVRWRVTATAEVYAKRDPKGALDLLRALLAGNEEPGGAIARTLVKHALRKYPGETFDALRQRHERAAPVLPPGAFGLVNFDRVADRLGAERLRWLIEHAWASLSDGKRMKRWFFRLSEGDRAAVLDTWLARGRGSWGAFLFRQVPAEDPRRETAYRRWSSSAQSREGIIDVGVLEWLPADLRHREARRHFALEVLSTRVDARNRYAALLPFAEATEVLASFLGHPEGEERAKAVRPLLATVRHEHADAKATDAALAFVRGRKFEQDPVRFAMLDTLAALPVRAFEPHHLPEIERIVADALDAADLSAATSAAAERLVIRLFRVDAAWGAAMLTTILAKRGSLGAHAGLVDALRPSDVDRLAPALASLAATWATQERAGALLWLGWSVGLRLRRIPALLDAMERLARELPFVGVAARALSLLHSHASERFAKLVPELVALDPSYVIVSDVATFLSVHRQDLLDAFLADAPMKGRFASGRTSWVISFARGHGRWSSRQQALHAAAWTKLLDDPARDVPSAISAVHALAQLAFAPRDTLLRFASDPRPPVLETAIRALPWLDEGQGIPLLLESLGDARARYAIYALRKAFSEMSRAEVLGHLRAAPTTKVTVAKEVVRLLGELGGDEAFAALLAFDARPDLHRDVRIALLRALWDHLERDATWPIFERAVADPDWVVGSKLADVPLHRLSTAAQAKVRDLLVAILRRPEPEARLALLARTAYLPLADGERTFFRALLDHVGAPRPDEGVAAARAVLARMRSEEAALVVARLEELAPRRQTMLALLPVFTVNAYSMQHVRAVAQGLVAILKRDPLATPHYVRFAASVVDWRGLVAMFDDLGKRDFLHADSMNAAYAAIAQSVHPALIEAHLAAHQNPRLRRLALEALKHAAAPENGWTAERRVKLATYQRDPAPLVAGAAAYVFPPEA